MSLKLSEITDSATMPALTDTLIGVGGGVADYQYTLQQVADTVGSGSSITEGVTPTSGFTDGYALISSSGKVGEAQIRTVLTGNVTGYVDAATGSDSNPWPGTSGAPLATLQFAWDFGTANFDGGGHNLTINCQGVGPYTLLAENGWIGFGEVDIVGDGSATTTITDFALADEAVFELGCQVAVDGATLTNINNEYCISSAAIGVLSIGGITNDIIIEPAAGFTFAGIGALRYSTIFVNQIAFAAGNGYTFGCYCQLDGNMQCYSAITLTGTPTFSGAFIFCEDQGSFYSVGMTFSGSATPGLGGLCGSTGGLIDLQGQDPADLPGGQGILIIPGGQWEGATTDYETPSTGATITMKLPFVDLVVNPATTLAALTVILPPVPAVVSDIPFPSNLCNATLAFTKSITSLSLITSDGTTILNAPTSITVSDGNVGFAFSFNISANEWYPNVGSIPSSGGGGSPGGSSGDIQYNNSGAFGGDPDFTTDGSGNVTANTINLSGDLVLMGGTSVAIELVNTGGGNNYFLADAGNTSASSFGNIGVGISALGNLTSAQNNVAIGTNALFSVSSSPDNLAFGDNAGLRISTGFGNNLVLGNGSGAQITTGFNNTCVGPNAGAFNGPVTGARNTLIGSQTYPATDITDVIMIGGPNDTYYIDYNYTFPDLWTIASGTGLALGNPYVATPITPTGYLILYDSNGVAYKIPAVAA